jgi:hypothetical protein
MFFVDQESIPGRKMLWKTSLAILVRLWRIIRASFSQERMTYIREESKVIYKSKDGRQQKAFDALEWRRQQAGCKHWLLCLLIYLIKESRWSDTMATTVMSAVGDGKRKTRMG